MNTVFFGLTGLGSAVLRGLLNCKDVIITSVYTKKYELPYPYYDEKQTGEICAESGIKCFYDKEINSSEVKNKIMSESPDLIIVASFNRIISGEVLKIPKLGVINFHPSLLPAYKGPYPDQAVLLNGEKETGVTVHYVTEKVDSGNIIFQRKILIDENDSYSTLKKKIAEVSEQIVPEICSLFKGNNIPDGIPQDETKSSYFPKPKEKDCLINSETDIEKIINKVKAFNPFPGTYILINNDRVYVSEYEILSNNKTAKGIYDSENYTDIYFNSRGIRLFKKK